MNPGCGWCRKADPIVEELRQEGFMITTLDTTNPDDSQKAKEITTKFNAQCGTPHFIDAETGNQVCGMKGKDILTKWANGEKIPAPPPRQPQQPQQMPGARPVPPVNPMAKVEFNFGVYQEAKQHLMDKFYNDFEVWNTWNYTHSDERPTECPISKKPTFPTHKAIKSEADKILQFVKESN
tara:strand:+ start:888 stop:1430 length:543 start_codon:yes stop_codon:yes gene_type:complete